MSIYCRLQITRRPEASNSSRPWVMLLMAVSRCWVFSDSLRCAAACWRRSWRTIRKTMAMTTTTASAAA